MFKKVIISCFFSLFLSVSIMASSIDESHDLIDMNTRQNGDNQDEISDNDLSSIDDISGIGEEVESSVRGIKRSHMIGAAILFVATAIAFLVYSSTGNQNPGPNGGESPHVPDAVEPENLGNSMISDITSVSNFDEIDPFNNRVAFEEDTIITRKRGNLSQPKYSKRLSQAAKAERQRKKHRRDPNLFQGS